MNYSLILSFSHSLIHPFSHFPFHPLSFSIVNNKKTHPTLDWQLHNQVAVVADLSKRLTFRTIAGEGLEITPDQWLILYHLWEEDGLTICQLAEKAKKDIANVSRIVDKLQHQNYVIKQRNQHDQRKMLVHVLPKGYSIRASVHRCCGTALSQVFQDISPEEQQLLSDLLTRLEKNIEQKLDSNDSKEKK